MDTAKLQATAKQLRREIVKMITEAGSGHPGGSLSAADILTVLYFDKMNVKPEDPNWLGRDYFVLSKGHAAPALYSTLAMRGYFPLEELASLRKLHSRLQGHPVSSKVPGVDVSTGSLGQGVSVACGLAKGLKIDNLPNRVYTMLGDGECQEGQVWEALMFAAHYQLDNLCVIIDHNRLQIDGQVADVMNVDPLDQKLDAFGFNVLLVNGHDLEAIGIMPLPARANPPPSSPTLLRARAFPLWKTKPAGTAPRPKLPRPNKPCRNCLEKAQIREDKQNV